MTDSDGYFSPRNHPQRMVFLANQDSSKQKTGETTPLLPTSNTPTPLYSSASASHTVYGASSAMGNPGDENPYAAPPYSPPFDGSGGGDPSSSAGWGQGWRRPRNMEEAWGGPSGHKNERSVRHLAKWLFVRISFAVLAYFLLRRVVGVSVNGHGGPGRPPPGRGKGPPFGHCAPRNGGVEETKRFTFDANPASFSFEQVSFYEHGSFPPGRIELFGDILVKGVEDAEDIAVDFHFRLTDEALKDRFSFDISEQGIIFRTNITPYDNIHSCIEVLATISVPLSKPSFASFSVSSESLNIILIPSLDLAVERLTLTALSGNIITRKAYGVDSNTTIIIVESGDIDGDFGLFDLVQLETKSGSITTSITPQDSSTHQAEFKAATMSGDIRTSFPFDASHLPKKRTYTSTVSTFSGSIDGLYLLGSHLSLTTLSGSVSASITPTGSQFATLITDTKQGDTDLAFRGLLGDGAWGLDATHRSVSGGVRVELPGDWEGVVTGKSISGEVNIDGKDVRIVEDERQWPVGRWVKGVKGVGEDGGKVEGETVNGDVSMRCGPGGHGGHGGYGGHGGPSGPGGHGGYGGQGGQGGQGGWMANWIGGLF